MKIEKADNYIPRRRGKWDAVRQAADGMKQGDTIKVSDSSWSESDTRRAASSLSSCLSSTFGRGQFRVSVNPDANCVYIHRINGD